MVSHLDRVVKRETETQMCATPQTNRVWARTAKGSSQVKQAA